MAQQLRFEDNVGLVHLQAKKCFKWAQGANAGLDYDDAFQIASLAFHVAAQGFNPDNGNGFSAYYTMVAFSEFRKEIGLMTGVKTLNAAQRAEIAARNEENQRRAAQALPPLDNMNYGLQPVTMSSLSYEDGSTFEENLASASVPPEQAYEFKEIVDAALDDLSPLAQLVVEWLRNPPPELLEEVARSNAYTDFARQQGHRARNYEGVSLAAVTKFLKLVGEISEGEICQVEAELSDAVKRIEKAYA